MRILDFSKNNSKNWVSEGKIKFIDYSVKYRLNTEFVLDNINITILPGEKNKCGWTNWSWQKHTKPSDM